MCVCVGVGWMVELPRLCPKGSLNSQLWARDETAPLVCTDLSSNLLVILEVKTKTVPFVNS